MASVFHGLSPYLPLAPGGVGRRKIWRTTLTTVVPISA